MRMKPFSLPDDLLLGSATSATQIDGCDAGNDWAEWSLSGRIADGSDCLRGAGHWDRVEEDIGLLCGMQHQIYRMGIEWSRIEPQQGRFDEEVVAHYRRELQLLVDRGIRPLVTLHHFSCPLWFSRMGGFESVRAPEIFSAYVRRVITALGDLASEYITINEPNVYVTNGYFRGIWPPGKKDLRLAFKVYRNLAHCHAAAYTAIHETRKTLGFQGRTMAGAAFHIRVFEGATRRPDDRIAARLMDHLFQGAIMKAMTTGRLTWPIGAGRIAGYAGDDRERSFGKDHGNIFADFLAVNYYSRSIVRAKGFTDGVHPDSPRNDLGWEIYPEGLSLLCRRFHKKFRLPVWITENGTCDNDDAFRSRFIYDHLLQVCALRREEIPVERYYHWSFLDNFEWLDGESARFGLVHVDFNDFSRTIKKSGLFYSRLIAVHGVTGEMIREFLAPDGPAD